MRIGFASDHRGYKLKNELINYLIEKGYEIEDCGAFSEESTDYPDYAFKLGNLVVTNEVDFGVAICGSGIGISIACNKVKGIRCAKVDSIEDVIATLEKAKEMIITFFNTPASKEEKHVRRINKIKEFEETNNV